jgi:hypothetical protein
MDGSYSKYLSTAGYGYALLLENANKRNSGVDKKKKRYTNPLVMVNGVIPRCHSSMDAENIALLKALDGVKRFISKYPEKSCDLVVHSDMGFFDRKHSSDKKERYLKLIEDFFSDISTKVNIYLEHVKGHQSNTYNNYIAKIHNKVDEIAVVARRYAEYELTKTLEMSNDGSKNKVIAIILPDDSVLPPSEKKRLYELGKEMAQLPFKYRLAKEDGRSVYSSPFVKGLERGFAGRHFQRRVSVLTHKKNRQIKESQNIYLSSVEKLRGMKYVGDDYGADYQLLLKAYRDIHIKKSDFKSGDLITIPTLKEHEKDTLALVMSAVYGTQSKMESHSKTGRDGVKASYFFDLSTKKGKSEPDGRNVDTIAFDSIENTIKSLRLDDGVIPTLSVVKGMNNLSLWVNDIKNKIDLVAGNNNSLSQSGKHSVEQDTSIKPKGYENKRTGNRVISTRSVSNDYSQNQKSSRFGRDWACNTLVDVVNNKFNHCNSANEKYLTLLTAFGLTEDTIIDSLKKQFEQIANGQGRMYPIVARLKLDVGGWNKQRKKLLANENKIKQEDVLKSRNKNNYIAPKANGSNVGVQVEPAFIVRR